MKLTRLARQGKEIALTFTHEPGDRGNIFYAFTQAIPPGDRRIDPAKPGWLVTHTPANVQILGHLFPDFSERWKALEEQPELFSRG